MKSLFASALLVLSFTSCKKVYDCECITSSTYKGFPSSTTTYQTDKLKKEQAESQCNQMDFQYRAGDPNTGNIYMVTTECTLK